MPDITPLPTPENETHALAEFLRGQLRVYRALHGDQHHIEVLALLAVTAGLIVDRSGEAKKL